MEIDIDALINYGYGTPFTDPIPSREIKSFFHWFSHISEQHRPESITSHLLGYLTAHDLGMMDLALLENVRLREFYNRSWLLQKRNLSAYYGKPIDYVFLDFFYSLEYMLKCSGSVFCRYFYYLNQPSIRMQFLYESCTSDKECIEKFARFIISIIILSTYTYINIQRKLVWGNHNWYLYELTNIKIITMESEVILIILTIILISKYIITTYLLG
jgi:hypothetical protein